MSKSINNKTYNIGDLIYVPACSLLGELNGFVDKDNLIDAFKKIVKFDKPIVGIYIQNSNIYNGHIVHFENKYYLVDDKNLYGYDDFNVLFACSINEGEY